MNDRRAGGSQTAKAVSWEFGGALIMYAVSFVRSLILARLLFPDDFGLFAMASTVMNALAALTEFNLASKLITESFSSEEEEEKWLNTVWTAGIWRGALLALLLMAVAYPVALAMKEPRLTSLLLVVSLGPFLASFENAGLTKLRRELKFGPLVKVRRASEIAGLIAAVAGAALSGGFWALAGAQLVTSITRVAVSYQVSSYRPRLCFDREVFRRCASFGRYLFVTTILTMVTTQFDNIVVANLLGAALLGSYVIAYRLAMLPVEVLGRVLNSALFPSYASQYRKNPEGMPAMFYRWNAISSVLVFVVLSPLILAPYDIVETLYGNKWQSAASVLAVCTLAGGGRALALTISPWLLASGRPDLDAKCKVVETFVFVGLVLYLVPRWGLEGAAWSSAVSYGLAFAMRLFLVIRIIPSSNAGGFFRIVQPVAIASAGLIGMYLLGARGIYAVAATSTYIILLALTMYTINKDMRNDAHRALAMIQRRLVPQQPTSVNR